MRTRAFYPDNFTISEFARAMRLNYPDALRLVKKMERAKLLARIPRVLGEDGRLRRYGLLP